VTTKTLANCAVTVIGLGLMGGSLALALKTQGAVKSIYGLDLDPATRDAAAPFLDRVTADISEAVAEADLVILAVPVQTILQLLPLIAPHLRPGTLVLDLGSVKAPIVTAMRELPAGIAAIGGHPMCGKESSGFAAADVDLYTGCIFALCECGRATPNQRVLAESLAQILGGIPMWINAALHDRAVAAISHLPYLLSMALVAHAADDADRETLLALASTGFRDTTRLAQSDLTMMGSILVANADAIREALAETHTQSESLLNAFINNSAADQARLRSIRAARRAWGEQFVRRTTKTDKINSQSK
jgi:prephenate dehydrogenase